MSKIEYLSKTKVLALREKWSQPDRAHDMTWEFDGVFHPKHWMSYNQEMDQGLALFDCSTFDELITVLTARLNRKPVIIDFMGGAYFLHHPENAGSITGIRIHNKDNVFMATYGDIDKFPANLYPKIIQAENRKVIDADILTNKGWNKIYQNSELADLLVCRPVGPFDNKHATKSKYDDPGVYAGLYISLFNRMIKLINPENGIVFTEIPDVFNDTDVSEFFDGFSHTRDCLTNLFTVPLPDYHWGGKKRRYAVIEFGKDNS